MIQLWHLRRTWEHLGKRDPLWAILTVSGKEGNKWQLEEFLATGRLEVDRLIANLDRIAPGMPRTRALDFGCGIGRVTRALADKFEHVTGVDVAASMIRLARRQNEGLSRCEFVRNRAADLRQFPSDRFALVYSRMVLQHMPPKLMRRYLPELLRLVSPGGVLVFQLPEVIDSFDMFLQAPVEGSAFKRRLPRRLVRAWRTLKYWTLVRRMRHIEMFGMSRPAVLELLERHGGRVLAVYEDHAHGLETPGFEYYVTK